MKIAGTKQLLAVLGALMLLVVAPISPATADKYEEARELKGTIASLSASLNEAAGRYNDAQDELEQTLGDLADTREHLAGTKRRLAQEQWHLNKRIKGIYRNGNIDFVEVVLGAKTFDQFLVRYDLLTRVGLSDAKLLKRIKRLKAELVRTYAKLRAQKERQARITAKLKKTRDEIDTKLATQQRMYDQVKAEIARMQELARQRRAQNAAAAAAAEAAAAQSGGGDGGTVAVSGNWAFPVAGPHGFSDDFGDPRSGGRSHQGCDIMASMGTPVVAVVGGSASIRENGLGGHCIWLSGNDGNEYYYAHLSGYASTGSVGIGEVIGYVGDSGNAAGTPHLHFEIHPGGGDAINPYPILSAHDS